MKILYVTQYYPPEIGAGAFRAEAIVTGLTKLGHRLTVISEIPNYPTGKIHKDYKNTLWQKESKEGIDIHRVWCRTSVKMNFTKRLSLYLSYDLTAILRGITLHENFDIVYATSPPLFTGIVSFTLSKFYRVPFVFEVRDVWPELAIEMGEVKNKIAIDASRRLEKFLYKKSSAIVTVTNGFKEKIVCKGIPSDKIKVVLNFSKSDNKIYSVDVNREIKNVFAEGRFVVLYAGLLGLLQGVKVIVNAADILRNQKNIVFVIIGTGVEETRLKMLARKKNLQNIIWIPPLPNNVVHFLLTKAGCSIIPLRSLPMLKMTIPSKLFDYMGCGCPIILSANGEVKQILEMTNAGIAVEPENPAQLANAIMQIYRNEQLSEKYRRNGIEAVRKYFSSEKAVQSIDMLLQFICKNK